MRKVRSTKPEDPKRAFECPQCGKRRMYRSLDYEANEGKQKYKAFKGHEVELYVDICDFCATKNQKKYFEPTAADVKTFLKAMKEVTKEDDVSLEDLL